MAVVKGTNCGFVTVAPSADPAGTNIQMDACSRAQVDTAPVGAGKIIEIGWWCETATEESNFEVGLYSDDPGVGPNIRLYVDNTNAKGTDAGWKKVTVDWDIIAGTVYWLAAQLDDTATKTNTNYTTGSGLQNAIPSGGGGTTLPSTWIFGSTSAALIPIYAVWQAAAGGGQMTTNTRYWGA